MVVWFSFKYKPIYPFAKRGRNEKVEENPLEQGVIKLI